MTKVAIAGAGAWGTTLAQILTDAGHEPLIWGRDSAVVDEINTAHTNTKFLGNPLLPHGVRATTDIKQAFTFAEVIVLAIPSQSLRENLQEWKSFFPADLPVVSSLKGIEISTQLRMSQVVEQVLGIDHNRIGFITGPNLASEIILRQPAAAVAASDNPAIAELVSTLFTTRYFRVYTSDDLLGCELAAATKSLIALAVGIVVGLNMGENTQAMMITRGLNEVTKLGVALGANPLTFAGLAGMGDLVASCSSSLSRNRTFGEELGRGGSMEYAHEHVAKTVEGVASASAVLDMAHGLGIEVPIIEAVADVISGKITPRQASYRLMSLDTGAELELEMENR